jgi:hypothetical protein
LQTARKDVGTQALSMGRVLSPQLADLTGGAYAMRVNGQPINLAVSTTDMPVSGVLDRLEAYCNNDADLVAKSWKDVPGARDWRPKGGDFTMNNLGVIRKESDGEGVVMCMSKGEHSAPTFEDALRQFAESRDLGRVGKLRYGYVQPSKGGGCRITVMWTEDRFDFGAFDIPPLADTPGNDSPTAPRPPGGQRIFSAEVVGLPYSIRLYQTDVSPEDVLRFYDQRMTAGDWIGYAPPADAHMYMKGGLITMVVASRKPGEPTMVSVADLGGEGAQGPVAPNGPLPNLQ